MCIEDSMNYDRNVVPQNSSGQEKCKSTTMITYSDDLKES